MTKLHVEADGLAHVPPAAVWALIADASSYGKWGPWSASGYKSPGDEARGGAGAIRWLRYGLTTIVEKVLEVESGRRMAYTVVKGLPVRNYRAEVTLTPAEAGTRIHWVADWDRTLGGRIVHSRLRPMFLKIVALLAAAAEQGRPS